MRKHHRHHVAAPTPLPRRAARPAAACAAACGSAVVSTLLQAAAPSLTLIKPPESPEAREAREAAAARAFYTRLLGAWRGGWPRDRNLLRWMRSLLTDPPTAAEAGLVLTAPGATATAVGGGGAEGSGDALIAVLNRALQAFVRPDGTRELPVTVDEVRALIATQSTQSADMLQLYYDFRRTAWDAAEFVVGAFEASSSAPAPPQAAHHHQAAPLMTPPRPEPVTMHPADETRLLAFTVARQPLNAIALTYRFGDGGQLFLTRHAPPLVYRPSAAPLLMDSTGRPPKTTKAAVAVVVVGVKKKSAGQQEAPTTGVPVDLANEAHLRLLTTVVYLARDAGEALRALNEGLRCSAASGASGGGGVPRLYIAPRAPRAVGQEVPLRVDVAGAILDAGLEFLMTANGALLPVPAAPGAVVVPSAFLERFAAPQVMPAPAPQAHPAAP